MELIPYSDFRFCTVVLAESISFAHEHRLSRFFNFLVDSQCHVYLYDTDRWDAVVKSIERKARCKIGS